MTNQITPTSVLMINRLSDAFRAEDFGFQVNSHVSFDAIGPIRQIGEPDDWDEPFATYLRERLENYPDKIEKELGSKQYIEFEGVTEFYEYSVNIDDEYWQNIGVEVDHYSITLNDNPDSPNYWGRMLPIQQDVFGKESDEYALHDVGVLDDSGNVEWARAHMHEGWRILARPLNGRLTGWFDYVQ